MTNKRNLYGILKYALFVSLFTVMYPCNIWAQVHNTDSRWYIGLKGGIPLGYSNFSSFAAKNGGIGVIGGVFGGYEFNSILSLEASVALGRLNMSAEQCYTDNGLWLGSDKNNYYAPVVGMHGWEYVDLKNKTFFQQYGVHINTNLLAIFKSSSQGRWALNISPALYAYGTKSTIRSITEDIDVLKDKTRWHLGIGTDLIAAYKISSSLSVGVYSGITYLTGRQLDAVPQRMHHRNFIWESGLRVRYTLRKSQSRNKNYPSITDPLVTLPVKTEVHEAVTDTKLIETPIIEMQQSDTVSQIIIDEPNVFVETITFPIIYFSFNSIWIEPNQREAVELIVELMRTNPNLEIQITGYTDPIGTVEVNRRVSLQRAIAVKSRIVGQGINENRIVTVGGGIYQNSVSAKESRHAAIIEIKSNQD